MGLQKIQPLRVRAQILIGKWPLTPSHLYELNGGFQGYKETTTQCSIDLER